MNQKTSIRAEIAKLGALFNPDILAATRALYADIIQPPSIKVYAALDMAYGSDARQTLDIYMVENDRLKPVLLYVPGGGFVGGDKRGDDIFYGNLARWFAAEGFVVVTMNYRLAPDHAWPAGAEDVAAALGWIVSHIGNHGGDAANILIFGQSAGATHVSTALFHPQITQPWPGLKGAVLSSGVYRMTAAQRAANLLSYFGTDESRYADRSPVTHVATNAIPLLLTVSEFDTADLSAPTYQLAEAITRRDGRPLQVVWLAGHNHVSNVLCFGSGDDAFGRKIIDFAKAVLM
jgi:acetyl esterase/lipase